MVVDVENYAAHIDKHFTLSTIQAILDAIRKGYSYDPAIRDQFPHREYAVIPAGMVRNRQADMHLLALNNKIVGWDATTFHVPRSPHVLTLVRFGPFLLVLCPHGHRRAPVRKSKTRLKLAYDSAISPRQPALFGIESMQPVPDDGYIFAVLAHSAEQGNNARLAGLELIILDQAYGTADKIDLILRARRLEQAGIEPVSVPQVRVRSKKKES
jgi:hypothetical protein